MLTDLGAFRTEYSSDANDIAAEFYNPCLGESLAYDRITGFFSSTIFHLTWRALGRFVLSNAGHMRLLCSPRLSERDAEGLLYGYQARDDESLSQKLCDELDEMLRSPRGDTARLMAALIAAGRLDVRLARVAEIAPAQTKRMFHDKVGLFFDDAGNTVGFRGSMNESFLGLSTLGHVESIDVWPSWEGGRDAERVRNATARFDRLWSGGIRGVEVFALPEAVSQEIERVAEGVNLEDLLQRLGNQSTSREQIVRAPAVGGIELRAHQRRAAAAWQENGLRGLLSHATGSGKTVTGLYCAQVMIEQGLTPIFVVPSNLLLDQWARQVKELLGCRVVLCGAGNDRWSSSGLVRAALEQRSPAVPYAVIAVLNSAVTPAFRSQVRPLASRVGVVVDEVHRIGSPQARGILQWLEAPARLGLSATPERANDPEGTKLTFDYFGGIVDRYTLADALEDDVLAPYVYEPSWVSLNDHEQEDWERLTTQIRRLYAMSQGASGADGHSDRLKMKLIERSRIAKGAAAKIPKAAEIIAGTYRPDAGQKWLVYCDDQDQLRSMRDALKDRGIPSWEYHSQMAGSSESTLRLFESNGGIIVAIKCLDEGVDIPSATHALILSSSRNPREFIQRRGRILRRSFGKTIATLQDVLVLPESVTPDDPTISLVFGELARALQFAEWSLSRNTVSRLEKKWVDLGLPLRQLDEIRMAGIEVDDDVDG
ncbi:DEAD/DEAH box helicase family protein [Kitasatospora sp. NPDC048365]|uniref:DEAD/DEAH box helicase family protein n=1 Tax=Kitasatospora sp. NPDC048365 TaxID=3364050 RepID=UPI00371B0E16